MGLSIAATPDGESLTRKLGAGAPSDPEVVALAGISAAELERYVRPRREAGNGGAVPQPPYDGAKPSQTMPDDMRALLSWPDERVTAMLSRRPASAASEKAL